MRERLAWLAAVIVLATLWLSGRRPAPTAAPASRPRAQPGVRLSMDQLHQQGGVPLGWRLTPPPGDPAAGRRAFTELGCNACHRVAGESFAQAADDTLGPELTGMGGHHPPAYFAEAILNPDAVLIDAPGYVGDDGHSRMPSYPEMTTGELSDLVAYLASLQPAGSAPSCHAAAGAAANARVTMSSVDLHDRPQPRAGEAHAFFSQTYDVLPGQLAAFEAWFASEGRTRFLAVDGLIRIDTFVDPARPETAITSQFGFRDETALRNFMADPATADLWTRFDAFVGPHGHWASERPLVYRAPSLSAEQPGLRDPAAHRAHHGEPSPAAFDRRPDAG